MRTKNYIFIIAVFLLTVVVIDITVGYILDGMRGKLPVDNEREAKIEYLLKHESSEVIIVGSSRAECNYDAQVLKDSLGFATVYNSGLSGFSFDATNILLNSMLDRYTPKVIIWDFKENQLAERSNVTSMGLTIFYPYWHESKYIRDYITALDGPELNLLFLSNCYRYNSGASRIIRAYLSPDVSRHKALGYDGRVVSDNRYTVTPADYTISDDAPLNEGKILEFRKTLGRIRDKGIICFVVVSPMYNNYNEDNIYTRETRSLCEEYGVHFIDDSHLEGFIHNNEYIYDDYHLNRIGGEVFTKELARQIKESL